MFWLNKWRTSHWANFDRRHRKSLNLNPRATLRQIKQRGKRKPAQCRFNKVRYLTQPNQSDPRRREKERDRATFLPQKKEKCSRETETAARSAIQKADASVAIDTGFSLSTLFRLAREAAIRRKTSRFTARHTIFTKQNKRGFSAQLKPTCALNPDSSRD